jgi:hypothetical protein
LRGEILASAVKLLREWAGAFACPPAALGHFCFQRDSHGYRCPSTSPPPPRPQKFADVMLRSMPFIEVVVRLRSSAARVV